MNKLFYPKQIAKSIRLKLKVSVWLSLVILVSAFTATMKLEAQCITVSKELLAVVPASSGIAGNIDATYRISVINPSTSSCAFVSNISVNEQFSNPSNLGAAFVRVVGIPLVAASGLSTPTTINAAFDGAADPSLTNNDGFLLMDDTIVYQVTAEINPRAVGAPLDLNNSVTANYAIPVGNLPVNSNIVTIPNCWTNCQMACNNSVNISVNSMCEADVLADMVLEGDFAECAALGFYSVSITYNGQAVAMPLNKSYVGKKLVVSVKNIVCGNSCWGYLFVEDKTPPALNCRARDTFRCNVDLSPSVFGFPVDIALVNQSVYPYIVEGIDACGSVRLTYHDSLVTHPCTDTLASTVYRRWCAKDPGGYEFCCTDTIDIVRGTLADLTLPPHYDGQPGNQPALRCNGSWTKFPNGSPDTTSTGTGRPQGLLCGNIQFDFSDDTIRVCPGTFKILRRWLIIDWCKVNSRFTYIQLIKVLDDVAPLVICPSTLTVNTDPNSCTGSFVLPVPLDLTPTTVVDNRFPYVLESCSGWTYSVTHRPASSPTNCTPDPTQFGTTQNITKLPNGQYKVSNMPFGCNWIYYRICDGCGNCTECTFDIEVKDLTPPVPICQQRTVVSLTENGQAIVPATVFDDHSFDNCEMGGFEIRRMFPGACGTTVYSATQVFCCSDIAASPIRIVMKVTDKAGNTSECMVDVIVQDKLPPRVTCPRDTVVTCEADLSNLNIFGSSTSTDNCSVTTSVRVENNLTPCNIGTIKRWFIATDAGSRKDSCSQTITVIDVNPFKESDITWPSDINLVGCKNSTGLDIAGKPIFRNLDKCNQIINNYEDLTFNYVEGVCYKILRKWTVIDWCNYDVSNPAPGRGVWYHTQVIKIVNNEKPSFTSSCLNRELCITENCSVTAVLSASATDDCTAQEELLWSYALDKDNNGTVDQTGTSKSVAPNLTSGVHKITWTVSDQCGNSSSCSYLITVRDCKAPTPYCNAGIVTVIMPSSQEITIWAKDFNVASTDNCTDPANLIYSFSSSTLDIFKTIHCGDLDNGKVDTFKVDIYVTDLAGNQDVCHTTLIVQDNQNVCPDHFTNTANISGLISGIDKSKMASNVQVQFFAMNNNSMIENKTNFEGKYAFENIDKNQPYLIKPILDVDQLNGVTTRDIVAIQKHILGKELIENPYYLIAADVNRSSSITTRDISDIRKLILGVTNEFPNNNPSWNFVDAKLKLNVENAFNYVSVINITQLNSSITDNNFIAIKSGDVTGEASTGVVNGVASRTNNISGLEIHETKVLEDNSYELVFYNSSILNEMEGFQLELNLDAKVGDIIGATSEFLKFSNSNYAVLDNNKIRISWNADKAITVKAGSELFRIQIKATINGTVDAKSLSLSNSNIASEVYMKDEDAKLKLLFRSKDHSQQDQYDLYQNVPNPFTGLTSVFFKVPNDQQVSIKIYDLAGRIVKQVSVNAKKGVNATEIELQNEQAGVLYYQLDAEDFIATRKMVIIR
ncbi:MAG: T9SS type A sorting domain-containing protein [Saprospiraceae bacterium]